MSQPLHTDDLARTSRDRTGDDDVIVAELAETAPPRPHQEQRQQVQDRGEVQPPGQDQGEVQPPGQDQARHQDQAQHQGRATTGQPTDSWPPQPDSKHWAGLSDHEALRARWEAIQAGFVDEPRRAVEDADALVAQVIQQLAESFATERARLETQWSRGDQVSTEDLRVALRRYRSFFQDLLSH
jgi:hypothetical protein